MEWDEIQANWEQYKVEAKQNWPRLNEAELEVTGGERDKLIDKVRDGQGVPHEDAAFEVDSWAQNL